MSRPPPHPSLQYGDAEPLLRALGGAAAPEGFQGGLNFSYTVGPSSNTTVKMVVKNEEHVGPVWNVIGTIPGTLPARLDQPIVLGNHRDAWVFGAVGEKKRFIGVFVDAYHVGGGVLSGKGRVYFCFFIVVCQEVCVVGTRLFSLVLRQFFLPRCGRFLWDSILRILSCMRIPSPNLPGGS